MAREEPTQSRSAEIRAAVRHKYRSIAEGPADQFGYPVGLESARGLGYEDAWLNAVPADVVAAFVGVGNPFSVHRPAPGEAVLDLGCGSGLDVFVAGLLTGPRGRAVGVDMTSEMLRCPRSALADRPRAHVSFVEALIEDLPFPDASFDTVLSNGVLNLVPDKSRAFAEIARVLAPGGVFAAADLLVVDTVPPETLASMDAWST
jgi:SAM-dependent methyltransferase